MHLFVYSYALFAKESWVFVIRTLSKTVLSVRLCLGSGGLFDFFFIFTVSVLQLYVPMFWFFVGGHNNTIPLEAHIEGISTYRFGLVSYYV
jgi:hypothetical protein